MELVKSLLKYTGESVTIQHEAGCKDPRSRHTYGKLIVDLDKLHIGTLRRKLAKKEKIIVHCANVPNALVTMGLQITEFIYSAEELANDELAKISKLKIHKLKILCNMVSMGCGTYYVNSREVTVTPAVIPYVDTKEINVTDDTMCYMRPVRIDRLPPSVRSLTFITSETIWINPNAFKQLEYFKARDANFKDYKGTPQHPKRYSKPTEDLPIEQQLDNYLIDINCDRQRNKVIRAIYVLRYLMSIVK